MGEHTKHVENFELQMQRAVFPGQGQGSILFYFIR